jgi:hypothetical protein
MAIVAVSIFRVNSIDNYEKVFDGYPGPRAVDA